MANDNKKRYTLRDHVIGWIKIAISAGLLGTGIWWMIASSNAHIKKVMSEGDSTVAIIGSIGYRSMTAYYTVAGEEFSYKKSIKGTSDDFLNRIHEGDSLTVYYMPDDPEEAYIRLDSWWNYGNGRP